MEKNIVGACLGKVGAAAGDQDVLLVAEGGELFVVLGVGIEIRACDRR